MNVQNKSASNIPWVKIGLIVGVIVLVGVFSGRRGLEEIFGLERGTLGGVEVAENTDSATENSSDSPSFDLDTDWKKADKDNSGKTNTPANRTSQKEDTPRKQESKFALERDGFVMRSPEGLTYYVGDRGENRIEHVMRHAKDQPNRPSHGVFVGSEDDILRLIDEAYSLVKSDSKRVKKSKDPNIDTRMAYEINMERKIGFKGGRSGSRAGNPDLRTLKLILDRGNRVITAYPYR